MASDPNTNHVGSLFLPGKLDLMTDSLVKVDHSQGESLNGPKWATGTFLRRRDAKAQRLTIQQNP
jgi:hypothetical protein